MPGIVADSGGLVHTETVPDRSGVALGITALLARYA
jgi:hypothetical protein